MEWNHGKCWQNGHFGQLINLRMLGPESTIAVVSHGAWINALLAVVSGHEIGSGKTRLKNACISMLYQEKNKWEIGFYNLTGEDIKNGIPVRI